MKLREQRATLYVEYLSDLDDLSPSPVVPNYKERHDEAIQYIENPDFEWIDIYEDDSEENLIGFIILGRGDGCHPDADVYIAGAFITYAYRNLGIMTARLLKEIGKEKVCCYFTTPGNDCGKRFFNKFFMSRGYTSAKLDRTYIRKEEAGSAFFGWARE